MKKQESPERLVESAHQAVNRTSVIIEIVGATAAAYYGERVIELLIGGGAVTPSLRTILIVSTALAAFLYLFVFGVYFFRRRDRMGAAVATLKSSLASAYLLELRRSQLNPSGPVVTSQYG